jgi:hypothetical protein
MNKKENPNGISSPRALEKKSTRARVVKCVKVHEYENTHAKRKSGEKKHIYEKRYLPALIFFLSANPKLNSSISIFFFVTTTTNRRNEKKSNRGGRSVYLFIYFDIKKIFCFFSTEKKVVPGEIFFEKEKIGRKRKFSSFLAHTPLLYTHTSRICFKVAPCTLVRYTH